MKPLLQVEKLNISFPDKSGENHISVVSNVDFSMQEGEILGLIGESGSGKTMTALAISGLLPATVSEKSGTIFFNGEDIFKESTQKRRLRAGKEISIIFQEPLSAFNPIMPIKKQLREIFEAHHETETENVLHDALSDVGFTDPERILEAYPHQLSGGQRQRVLLAGAILLRPKLLIADEVTTALDSISQKQILALLKELSAKYQMGILFISHDLLLVRDFCDRVLLFEGNRVTTSGVPSDFSSITPKNHPFPSMPENSFPILEINALSAGYREPFKKRSENDMILKNIHLTIHEGEALGLVGMSGGGKTTLARIVTGLLHGYEGKIKRNGAPYVSFHNGRATFSNKKVFKKSSAAMIFQDPYQSLHPYRKIGWILEEPLRKRKDISRKKRREMAMEMLSDVGLPVSYMEYYPNQLSGGQRQRISLAMNLMLSPALLVADEPFSAVDIPTRIQLIALLKNLQEKRRFGILLISHDLEAVRSLCHSICIIENGQIIESGSCRDIFTAPKHIATKRLLGMSE